MEGEEVVDTTQGRHVRCCPTLRLASFAFIDLSFEVVFFSLEGWPLGFGGISISIVGWWF